MKKCCLVFYFFESIPLPPLSCTDTKKQIYQNFLSHTLHVLRTSGIFTWGQKWSEKVCISLLDECKYWCDQTAQHVSPVLIPS